ncbi:unnamed protein product [Linum trigynum]|uniref:Uncharacterized protein n=1 Tax=Linum trigynum TaxID=586398 RepID=A0AAV2DZM6_9ROSI
MLNKTPPHMMHLFEDMAVQGYDCGNTRRGWSPQGRGVHSVEAQPSPLESRVFELITVIDRNGGLGGGPCKSRVMYCQCCENTIHMVEDYQAMRESNTP